MMDLLANKKENIKILTNSENDVVVENLTTHTVISYESTMELVHKGISKKLFFGGQLFYVTPRQLNANIC